MSIKKILTFASMITLILLSGCFSNTKLTGPSWTTKITLPLILRTRNTETPSQSSEIYLDNTTNGLGEEGLNLQNSNSYSFDAQNWQSTPLGFMNITLNSITALNLSAYPNATVNIPSLATNPFDFSDTSYVSIALSGPGDAGSDPTKNKVTINLTGGTADGAGLSIKLHHDLDDNGIAEVIATTTMNAGEDTATLDVAGLTLDPSKTFYIEFGGTLTKTQAFAQIEFVTSQFEIASFTVASGLLDDKAGTLLDDNIQFSYELLEDTPLVELSSGQINLDVNITGINNMSINSTLVIEPQDENQQPIAGQTQNKAINLLPNQTNNIDITNELNTVLAAKPHYLDIRMINSTLSNSADVTISHATTVSTNLQFVVGFNSITTNPQVSEVDESLDTEMLKTAAVILEINNQSPLALNLAIKLFPDNDNNPQNTPPTPAPEDLVTLNIAIEANNTKTSTLQITADDLKKLFRNQNFYNQIIITNSSNGAPIPAGSYIEVRSRAEVEVLVNK